MRFGIGLLVAVLCVTATLAAVSRVRPRTDVESGLAASSPLRGSTDGLRALLEQAAGGPDAWARRQSDWTSPSQLFGWLMDTLIGSDRLKLAKAAFGDRQSSASVPNFFGFVPHYRGSALIGGAPVTFETGCYEKVEVRATHQWPGNPDTMEINVTASGEKTLGCSDELFFTSSFTFNTLNVGSPREWTILNLTGFSDADTWMLHKYGVRVHTMNVTGSDLWTSIVDTALLFVPNILGSNDVMFEQLNMDFFNRFTQFKPPVTFRTNTSILNLDESEIADGDILFCSDMDGMGTIIGVGEGGSANHVTVALRDDSGVLHVCEATDPMLRCTPYRRWIEDASAIPMTVVLAPLAPSYSAAFDRAAAWRFINETVGLSYGYQNFLFGWIDTANDNYPCMPPDYERCLVWEHLEFVAALFDLVAPEAADTFFMQALNHRVNSTGLGFAEVMKRGYDLAGFVGGDVTAVPEQDSWRYNTTRNGKPAVGRSNVCSTFACNVLKHAGSFAGTPLADIQCTEQTPWNMLALQLYDNAKLGANRPAACVERDPDNANCVLCGHTTFHLGPNANEKVPTVNTGEHCGGIAPWYQRSPDC